MRWFRRSVRATSPRRTPDEPSCTSPFTVSASGTCPQALPARHSTATTANKTRLFSTSLLRKCLVEWASAETLPAGWNNSYVVRMTSRLGMGGLLDRFVLAMQFFRQNDGFRQFPHGTAQSPALVAQAQVSLFFGDVVVLLQDSLGALHQLAGFELPLHLLRFFQQARVFFFQQRL